MNLLGIESSGQVASAAVIRDDVLVAEFTLNNGMTHSQTLLPIIDQVLKMADMEAKDLDVVAVSKGPGSFTGLRIGSATAKGLGLALDIPLAEVSTLEGMAYSLKECTGKLLCPIIDSRRQEVYAGIYESVYENGEYRMNCVMEDSAMTLVALIDKLNALGRPCVFNGDAVKAYGKVIEDKLTCDFSFATGRSLMPNAASVAEAGSAVFRAGKAVNADNHSPEYLRLSQAERELQENNSRK